jgi:nucleoside-diphosphate-sugar epimerase
MRPLDVDDLSRAILGVCRHHTSGTRVLELAGPEPISYRDLIERVATMMGRPVAWRVVPIWAAKLGAALRSRMTGGGVTPTVIDVITTSESVEHNAEADLGVTLTPLSETLEKIVTAWRHTT